MRSGRPLSGALGVESVSTILGVFPNQLQLCRSQGDNSFLGAAFLLVILALLQSLAAA